MLAFLLMSTMATAQETQTAGDWRYQPFFRPQAGLSAWSGEAGTTTALNLGAQAGVRFKHKDRQNPGIQGVARARGTYLVSSAQGIDVRTGVFAGPAWERLRLQTGPDLFWNTYDWGFVELEPTLGLAWPVLALTNLGGVALSAGLQPSVFLRSDRASVDWSEQSVPGFGDEMTYFGSAGVALGSLRVNLSLSLTVTAYGMDRGLGFGIRI
jgi:hypothetical protein